MGVREQLGSVFHCGDRGLNSACQDQWPSPVKVLKCGKGFLKILPNVKANQLFSPTVYENSHFSTDFASSEH